jgi:hypothetical protein
VTPENGGYMVAAYIAAVVILVTYTVLLFLKSRDLDD